ncbi:MAG: hypothetical protein V4598_08070 [Bdellovibrionota bacterium]
MKLIVVFILVLLPLLGFSQEGASTGVDTTAHDEAVLDELEKAREDRQKSLEQVSKVADATEKAFDPITELKKLGYDSFTPASLMNKDAVALLERTLKEARMHTIPPELLKEKVHEAFKGHPIEGYLKNNPKAVDFIVDVMRDEKAVVSGLHIMKDKDRLKTYLYVWIVIMFFAYFTRKLFVSKYWNKWLRGIASFAFSVTISVISLSAFCLIFEEEMKPLLTIIKRYI